MRETFLAPLGITRTVTSIRALPALGNVATPHAAFEPPLRAFAWSNEDFWFWEPRFLRSLDAGR